MSYPDTLQRISNGLLILGAVLIIYGYMSRLFGLYFFWEGLSIGWSVFLLGVVFFLFQLISKRAALGHKTLLIKIGVGLLIFYLVVQCIFSIVVSHSSAYEAAKLYVGRDPAVVAETGIVYGFGLIPSGNISVSSDNKGEQGQADIVLIVKGHQKFKEYTVHLEKATDMPEWKVVSIR